MKYSTGLFLLICSVTVGVGNKHYGMRFSSAGSSLQCYKCADYYGGWCENVQDCSYEDSCLSLHEKGGKTIRQCIRYTDCDNSRLSQMFPAVSGFTYRCCTSNLCNSAHSVDIPLLSLLISFIGLCWSCCSV
ncbi:CD59 glycoprotein [Astyanax mexicanus]|uniref:CD59 glycoprotein-like n=1 Tax=Astyanax mexicanus TaxID=7994 RepID=A0A8B9HC49_ASTMX|nr:CD59 glycoprotein [Astyanax mexicanus]KAG9280791.1 CD59 glycoprotein-like isoform X1 [Astyanax mexicanus]